MPLIEIHSPADPRIADYLDIREAELRKDRFDAPGGLFIAEGELVYRRLLTSRFRTRSVLVTPTRLRTIDDTLSALAPDTPVYLVDQATMNRVVGINIHRGILAIGERGPEPALAELLRAKRIAVLLEDLVNHDNLGGVFRNTAALAGPKAAAVLLSPRCADPLYRKSIRVSMGHVLSVPYARLADGQQALARLRELGFTLIALTPRPDADDIVEVADRLAPGARCALILGTEGPGLSEVTLTQADIRARIRMPGATDQTRPSLGHIDSLNVSVAAAIALHRLAPCSLNRRTSHPDAP
jgi:tRNA G18 (ribose-2'-O)-methylase SpoU